MTALAPVHFGRAWPINPHAPICPVAVQTEEAEGIVFPGGQQVFKACVGVGHARYDSDSRRVRVAVIFVQGRDYLSEPPTLDLTTVELY